MQVSWSCLKFEELNNESLYKILTVRLEVFVLEQSCFYQDIDGKDIACLHLFAQQEDEVIAYARLIPPGISYPEPSIGRVLVKSNHRNSGLGFTLMQKAIDALQQLYPNTDICISAQSYLEKFYTSLGFKQENEPYLEDDIPHMKMRLAAAKS